MMRLLKKSEEIDFSLPYELSLVAREGFRNLKSVFYIHLYTDVKQLKFFVFRRLISDSF